MSQIQQILSQLLAPEYLAAYHSGKSFDEIYEDPGAFQYDKAGFTLSYNGLSARIFWSDITQINAFKTDLENIDRIEMEIHCGDDIFTIQEELPGWFQFVRQTKAVFPDIPQDWDIRIMNPPFAANFTTLYDQEAKPGPRVQG